MTATSWAGGALRRHRGDLFGIAWIVLFALLYLSPALKDGPQFAPADLGAQNSPITAGALRLETNCVAAPGPGGPAVAPGPAPASCTHDDTNGDEITQAIPWNTTDWLDVRAGHFPLWNDLEGNGLPQFLNFESGALALPSLVGYLVPLSESFLVTVLMKLLIAGIGTYLLCRLLGCRALAAAFGGTSFMLSGSFAGWLGWSLSGTLCWVGAILFGLLWSYRSRARALPIAVLALSVAFALYGGFVEAYALLAGFCIVLLGAGALMLLASHRGLSRAGAGRVAAGTAAGVALAAPLWLTGESVLRASVRSGEVTARGLSLHGAVLLLAQGYDGLPTAGSTFFGVGLPNYFESAAYVGVLALVFAGVALVLLHRRPAVVAFTAAAVAAFLLAYRLGPIDPIQRLVIDIGLGTVDVSRVLPLLAFAIAVLAAIGAEAIVTRFAEPVLHRALLGCGLLVALAVAILGVKSLSGLAAPYLALRQASLYWPVATLVLFGALALLLLTRPALPGRSGLSAGSALVGLVLVGQSAFLLFAGVGINSYATTAYPVTPAVAALKSIVGSSLVAMDDAASARCYRIAPAGFYPNENVGYGIDELAVHDPIAPSSYFDSWPIQNVGQKASGSCPGVNVFAPAVDTVALARRYGASYVLASTVGPQPSGMAKIAVIGPDTLYAVPGSARFTIGAPDRLFGIAHPGDARYTVSVHAPASATLVARITDEPGWHASADGHALVVHVADGTFLSVTVPAGATTVVLSYSLPHLLPALVLFVLGVLALAAFALGGLGRRVGRPRGQ